MVVVMEIYYLVVDFVVRSGERGSAALLTLTIIQPSLLFTPPTHHSLPTHSYYT
jgi:hypothetical protein